MRSAEDAAKKAYADMLQIYYLSGDIGKVISVLEQALTEYGDARADEAVDKSADIAFESFGTCGECASLIGHEIRALKSTAKDATPATGLTERI